eukprot:TRINITY_DN8545_c0_g1_i1.p1 TRINITY_DN8545_c0_g1~~TRINITY_DN8545_c0_g1_i1.p1  ORF type:complete len:454 (-),score=43.99 TRINITY_DN8545_c0_g1_i1:39-1208(-)
MDADNLAALQFHPAIKSAGNVDTPLQKSALPNVPLTTGLRSRAALGRGPRPPRTRHLHVNSSRRLSTAHRLAATLRSYRHCTSRTYGEGTTVFVVDSAPDPEYLETALLLDPIYVSVMGSTQDTHGTFMAIKVVEVAPLTQLQPIVIPDECTDLHLIRALYKIYSMTGPGHKVPAVVLNSFSAERPGHSAILDMFYELVLSAEVPVVVSVGNDHREACLYSPNTIPDIITVARPTGPTGYGPCVKFMSNPFIYSASDTVQDGATSASTAHAAGVTALLLADTLPRRLSVLQVEQTLLTSADAHFHPPLLLCHKNIVLSNHTMPRVVSAYPSAIPLRMMRLLWLGLSAFAAVFFWNSCAILRHRSAHREHLVAIGLCTIGMYACSFVLIL